MGNYVTLCRFNVVDSDSVPVGKLCVMDGSSNRNLLDAKCLVNLQGIQLYFVPELQFLGSENH